MVLAIDEDKCIGCGVCASMLDEVYEMDDDRGVAIVKQYKDVDEEDLLETIDACPVEAISL